MKVRVTLEIRDPVNAHQLRAFLKMLKRRYGWKCLQLEVDDGRPEIRNAADHDQPRTQVPA
jgi:hypothetical protein